MAHRPVTPQPEKRYPHDHKLWIETPLDTALQAQAKAEGRDVTEVMRRILREHYSLPLFVPKPPRRRKVR